MTAATSKSGDKDERQPLVWTEEVSEAEPEAQVFTASIPEPYLTRIAQAVELGPSSIAAASQGEDSSPPDFLPSAPRRWSTFATFFDSLVEIGGVAIPVVLVAGAAVLGIMYSGSTNPWTLIILTACTTSVLVAVVLRTGAHVHMKADRAGIEVKPPEVAKSTARKENSTSTSHKSKKPLRKKRRKK